MISAAPVMRRAVEPTPKATASVVSPVCVVALADPAEQEDLVVHREPEEDGEEEERHPGLDRVRLLEAEQLGADALLEDEHEQAVGGADREQVERDRGRRRPRSSGRRPSAGRSSARARRRSRSAARVDHGVEVVDVLRASSPPTRTSASVPGERLRDDLARGARERRRSPRSPTGRLRPAPRATATSPSADALDARRRRSADRAASCVRELGERRATVRRRRRRRRRRSRPGRSCCPGSRARARRSPASRRSGRAAC